MRFTVLLLLVAAMTVSATAQNNFAGSSQHFQEPLKVELLPAPVHIGNSQDSFFFPPSISSEAKEEGTKTFVRTSPRQESGEQFVWVITLDSVDGEQTATISSQP